MYRQHLWTWYRQQIQHTLEVDYFASRPIQRESFDLADGPPSIGDERIALGTRRTELNYELSLV